MIDMQRVYDRKEDCCGCALCVDICPTQAICMEMIDGFSYPTIQTEKCVDCGACRRGCIIQQPFEDLRRPVMAYAGKLRNTDARLNSSSGGMFTAVSDMVLSSGGAVCGAAFDEGMRLRYVLAQTAEDRDKMRDSKYVQSDAQGLYAQLQTVLQEGKTVLFCGTPCTAAAVKRRFSTFTDQLYIVDLICHGVPSPEVWQGYIAYIERLYGKSVSAYRFRDKQNGAKEYHAVITFTDGTTAKETDAINSYLELFRYDLCLRPSCTACPYATQKRVGDITIGDFWGVETLLPYMDDQKGVSAVLINTEKGKTCLRDVSEQVEIAPCAVNDIVSRQQPLQHPSKASVKAPTFARDMRMLPFRKILQKYTRVGRKRRVIDCMKRVFGK